MPVVQALTVDWFDANVQRGSAVFVAVGLVDVVFLIPFVNVPRIVLTPGTHTTRTFAAVNKTTTGFRITSNGSVTLSVDWVAVVR